MLIFFLKLQINSSRSFKGEVETFLYTSVLQDSSPTAGLKSPNILGTYEGIISSYPESRESTLISVKFVYITLDDFISGTWTFSIFVRLNCIRSNLARTEFKYSHDHNAYSWRAFWASISGMSSLSVDLSCISTFLSRFLIAFLIWLLQSSINTLM